MTASNPIEQPPATAGEAPASASPPELEEPVLLPPRGLIWLTLALLVATAAVAVLFAPPVRAVVQPSLRLATWPGEPRELEEMLARDDALLRTQSAQASPASEALAADLRRDLAVWLAAEATLGTLDVQHDLTARQVLGSLEERVRTLVLQRGPDALRALAVRYGRDVREATELALVHPDQLGPLQAIAPGWYRTMQGMELQRFIENGHLQPAAARVVEGLAQLRVLELATRLPQRPTLPSDQQALILRFRVEAYDALPVERKLALLSRLASSDPTYPSVFVRGVLLARVGQCQPAIVAWQQAVRMGQQAARARANIAWCEDHLAGPK